MADWKIICLSSIIGAIISIVLWSAFLPLFILGPFIGGFVASYFSKDYETYTGMDRKDGAIIGVLSGIIWGLIFSLALIFGLGAIKILTGLISTKMGLIADSIIAGYVTFQLSVIIGMILGALGGELWHCCQ